MDPVDNRLLKDLDRLRTRVNSEAGIPMFLACEDLAPTALRDSSTSSALPDLNGGFVSKFRLDVECVQSSCPDAPLTDIAKIVERLSEQDFALSSTEQDS